MEPAFTETDIELFKKYIKNIISFKKVFSKRNTFLSYNYLTLLYKVFCFYITKILLKFYYYDCFNYQENRS